MLLGMLEGSHFHICGEESFGSTIRKNSINNHNYSIKLDINKKISLNDKINKNKEVIEAVDDINVNTKGGIFDPQKLENVSDVSDIFLDYDKVYCMNKCLSHDNIVYRNIEIVTFISFNGKRICNHKRQKIVDSSKQIQDRLELTNYENDEIYFVLNKENDRMFEENIKENIFDDEWLSEIIENYI